MLLSLRFQQEPNTLLFGSKLGDQGVSTHYYSLMYLKEERAIIHVIIPLIVDGGWRDDNTFIVR